uniref:Uncharacterized protein n=1 Tax=Leersia perrieri TaxID=77586 RepID=A0A0D9Y1R4_9ORYZ
MASPVSRFVAVVAKKNKSPLIRRRFASSARHDDAEEAAKWEKITYLGIGVCTLLAAYNLSTGPDGFFEKKKHSDDHH